MDKSKNLKRDLYNISKKTGKGKLGIYYSYRGTVKRFPSGVECAPDYWDKKNCQVKKDGISDSDRAIVDNLYNTINKVITEHLFRFNQLPPVDYISDNLEKPEEVPEDIHELYAEFLKYKKATVADSTYDKFYYIGKFLKEVDKRNKYNLNLNNFNFNFIQKFISYLIDVRKNQNSSVITRINDLKGFVEWINKKEIPNTIKAHLWEIPDDNSAEDFTCLERDELNAILQYKPNPSDSPSVQKRDQKNKDIIVFLSHTGMRIGDMQNITKHNIKNGCIDFVPQKTKRKKIRAIVPITKPVAEILDRYDYKLPYYKSERSLSLNLKNFCAKIKELQHEVSYTEVVENRPITKVGPKYSILNSHGLGRKTFINLCIEKKVQLTTIAGMTGHTEIDTIIKHYADKHANKQTALAEVFDM